MAASVGKTAPTAIIVFGVTEATSGDAAVIFSMIWVIVLENLKERTKVEARNAGDGYARGRIVGDKWSGEGSRA